eukprot:1482794-Rhodomonas_salina.1
MRPPTTRAWAPSAFPTMSPFMCPSARRGRISGALAQGFVGGSVGDRDLAWQFKFKGLKCDLVSAADRFEAAGRAIQTNMMGSHACLGRVILRLSGMVERREGWSRMTEGAERARDRRVPLPPLVKTRPTTLSLRDIERHSATSSGCLPSFSLCDFLFSLVFSAPLLSPSGLPLVGAAQESRLSHAHPCPGSSIYVTPADAHHTDESAPTNVKRQLLPFSDTCGAVETEGNVLPPTDSPRALAAHHLSQPQFHRSITK